MCSINGIFAFRSLPVLIKAKDQVEVERERSLKTLWTCCAEPLFIPLGVKDIAWLPDHDVVRDRRLIKAGQVGDVPRATSLKSFSGKRKKGE